jgi:hypothetical protein
MIACQAKSLARASLESVRFSEEMRICESKQPASQPASKRTPHEQAAEAKAMLCVHKGRGVFFFFFFLKAKKTPNLKKQLQ